MRVGRYVDGRDLTYDESNSQFAVGGTPVTLEQVLQYDAFAQIEWSSDEIRAWVQEVQAGAHGEVRAEVPKGSRLLGFRSRRLWKMAVASIYYVSWGIFTVAVVATRSPYVADVRDRAIDVVASLILAGMAISPALFLSDFNYRQRLPFFKRRKVL